jgi:hypothetical protein
MPRVLRTPPAIAISDGEEERRALGRRGIVVAAAALSLTAAGLVLWALALPDVDLRAMTDAGLVSVLPTQVLLAIALVSCAFLLSLHYRPSGPLLLTHLVALILILFATPLIIEAVPHFSATWRHVGIIDYIVRTHQVDPNIDAYFNWPGFFIFGAFLSDVAGVDSTLGLARWAPLAYDLLYLLPVFLIARAVSADRRLIWTTLFIFTITNWIGQDYFSPQATTYFFYLVVIALLLSWFATSSRAPSLALARSEPAESDAGLSTPDPAAGAALAQRAAAVPRALVLLAVIVLIAATVPSHQLTPFAFLAATTALVLTRACTARGLPVIVLVMIVSWVTFMSVAYLAGHFGSVAGGVGKVDQNVSTSLSGRIHGSPDHVIVVMTRLAMTVAVWLLALVGFLRRLGRHRNTALAALALAPFSMIGLQSYGGEVLLRIYLFALPFMALFAAAAFFPQRKGRVSWLTTGALAVVTGVLILGFLVSRYGNERADFFTPGEANAVRYVQRVAPTGSRIVSLSRNYPRRFGRYEQLRSTFVNELPEWQGLFLTPATIPAAIRVIERAMGPASRGQPSYLIVTRSQIADMELFSNLQPGALRLLDDRLRHSPQFRTVYSNRDAVVLRLPTPRSKP